MKKRISKKTAGNAALIALIFCIGSWLLVFLWVFPTQPNSGQINREFQQNTEHFCIVAEYLLDTDFDSITIWRTHQKEDAADIEMFAGLEQGDILINDELISQSIRYLFEQGYELINKTEEGVNFQRWSALNKGLGIVYWVDDCVGQPSRLLPYLVESTSLTEENWYFYLEDFDRWKAEGEG